MGPYEVLKKITKRDYSQIFHVKIGGIDYCLKWINSDKRWTIKDIHNSYQIYEMLEDKRGLVKVFEYGMAQINDPGEYYVLMEYLEGFERIDFRTFAPYADKMKEIEGNLLHQKVIQLDMVPINFMTDGQRVVMIDLDKLYKLPNLFYPPDGPTQAFTWYGYANARMKLHQVYQERGGSVGKN